LSVPYETACEPAESPETPQELLARLLGRALNSFELSDELVRRLDTALAHDSALHSAHHSGRLHRITYRHTWLLPDGSAFTLWELAHNTGLLSQDQAPGDTPGPLPPHAQPAHGQPGQERPRHGHQDHGPSRRGHQDHQPPRQEQLRHEEFPYAGPRPGPYDRGGWLDQHELYADEAQLRTAMARLPLPLDEPLGFDLPFTVQLPPIPFPRHVYVPDNSADHARRLLRRAENPDRPDADTLRLLHTAFAHQITQAFGRPAASNEKRLGFSLYEHAFLLADGREISLWEVEHTATPDGRHMCEVYATESAARKAMELRASRAN
jgi:hypothetical protein